MSPAERLAVHDTLARYAFALDRHDPAALEAVLTADATWTFHLPGRPVLGPVAGREAVLEFVRTAWAAETGQRRHHPTNVVVHGADGETASATAYLLLTSDAAVLTTGVLTFRLARTGGEWRIAELVLAADDASGTPAGSALLSTPWSVRHRR
ncbi:SnoaL-like domain-containing protein [Lentzea xinjiangensis]|uniref:SnoaL-like domain-containing protein n=1 Tax=Lentzea xinjiangensis TaxID=402600 RepID=A0A1H9SWE8_9PSEU|nr:nuclear transport factor 2 family protein [Lentzea xinjiangensis]SER89226.1 SnoaL-like domain-containing protein [Lentzea xinjiangensis]